MTTSLLLTARRKSDPVPVFEAGEQSSPNAVTKEKAAEIAADFNTTFYHEQVGALETQKFRTTPAPFWLVCFSDTVKGADERNVLCRSPARWDGCCAEGGKAAVGVANYDGHYCFWPDFPSDH